MTDLPTAHDEEHWRTCLHESGHAWSIHHLLGDRLLLVSVRRGAGHAGTTISESSEPPPRLGSHPLDGLDPAERQRADKMLVNCLIGDAAEQAFEIWTPIGGFAQLVVDAGPPELSLKAAFALATGEADPKSEPLHDDTVQAVALAEALVGPATAGYYLRWATAEARQAAHAGAAPIHALASTLWREPIIAGQKAAAILDKAHERNTHP